MCFFCLVGGRNIPVVVVALGVHLTADNDAYASSMFKTIIRGKMFGTVEVGEKNGSFIFMS